MSLDETKRPEEGTEPSSPAENASDEGLFDSFLIPVKPEEKKPKKGKISPRIRTLIIALATVVALVAVLLLIPLLPDEQPLSSGSVSSSAPVEETITLLDKTIKGDSKTKPVTKVVIRNADDEYTMLYNSQEDVFQLVGFEDLQLNKEMTANLVTCGATLTAQRKIETVNTLADFGLDKPAVTATVTYHDGTTATLQIGNLAPNKSSYYAKLADDDAVYLLASSGINPFLLDKEEYVQTTLITAPLVKSDDNGNGQAVLREITIRGKALPKPLVIRRATAKDGAEFAYFEYLIESPYVRGTSDTAINALSGFTSLSADDAVLLHPTKQQLKELGFDDPYMVADITLAIETYPSSDSSSATAGAASEDAIVYGSTDYRLTIAGMTEEREFVIMVDGIDAVFTVAEDILGGLAQRTYENSVSRLLFLKDITSIGRVEIGMEGKTYNFQLTHKPDEKDSDKKLTVTMDGKAYSTDNFRNLYQITMGLERYDTEPVAPSGTPELTISLYLNDGTEYLSTAFYPQTGSLHTVKTTEGELLCVRSSFVTHFHEQVHHFLNGESVLLR